jgi:type IV secretory pathway component VirB8
MILKNLHKLSKASFIIVVVIVVIILVTVTAITLTSPLPEVQEHESYLIKYRFYASRSPTFPTL